MAILAPYPAIQAPEDIRDLFADSRSFAFRSVDGHIILPCTGQEFIAMWGAQGLDVPDPDIVEGLVPGMDGSVIDDITVGSRKVLLPLWIGSDSGHRAYLNNRAALRRMFDHRRVDYRRLDGTFDLVAISELGERSLRCTYQTGMAGDWAQDSAGTYWERLGLSFLAVRTYWYGARWSSPVIRIAAGRNFFASFPPRLSSTVALGANIPVLVDGEVDSWPRIDLVGPADSVLVEAPGLHIEIPAGLAAGEVAVINTDPRPGQTEASFDGTSGWARVGPVFSRAPLAPGLNPVTIALTNATSATQAVLSGDSMWLTPW